jgi:hypothetical protein
MSHTVVTDDRRFRISQDSNTILVPHRLLVADCLKQMHLLQPGKPSESITRKSRVRKRLPTSYPTRDLGPTTEGDISDWNMQ